LHWLSKFHVGRSPCSSGQKSFEISIMKLLSSHHFVFLISGLFLLVAVSSGHAQQLTKQEEDRYKSLAKQYKKNPAMLASLMGKYNDYKDENKELSEKINLLEASSNRKSERINELEGQVSSLQTQLAQEQSQEVEPVYVPPTDPESEWKKGVVFKVQVGAFAENKIPEEWDTAIGLDIEDEDGLQKIVVGKFRDYNEAGELKKRLMKMGVKGAWIASYRDGVRVPINQVQ
jgi:hypothetical protein